jgi:hypothetical protein
MHIARRGRPSPALIVSALALFASMGGTGWAATHAATHHPRKKKPAKALTTAQVNRLIAGYVHAHAAELRGPTGAQGPAGATGPQGAAGKTGAKGDAGPAGKDGAPGQPGVKGDTGPQGPGATPVTDSEVGGGANADVATFGPWTVGFSCSSQTNQATVTITGSGSYWRSTQTGTSSVTESQASGSLPVTLNVTNSSGQASETVLLKSGTSLEQVTLHETAANGGLFESCVLVGDAIPVPAS